MAKRITETKLEENICKRMERKHKKLVEKIEKLTAAYEEDAVNARRDERLKADSRFVYDLIREAGLKTCGDIVSLGTTIYPRWLYHYQGTYDLDGTGTPRSWASSEVTKFLARSTTQIWGLEVYTQAPMRAHPGVTGSGIQSWTAVPQDTVAEKIANDAALDALEATLVTNGVCYLRVEGLILVEV